MLTAGRLLYSIPTGDFMENISRGLGELWNKLDKVEQKIDALNKKMRL